MTHTQRFQESSIQNYNQDFHHFPIQSKKFILNFNVPKNFMDCHFQKVFDNKTPFLYRKTTYIYVVFFILTHCEESKSVQGVKGVQNYP